MNWVNVAFAFLFFFPLSIWCLNCSHVLLCYKPYFSPIPAIPRSKMNHFPICPYTTQATHRLFFYNRFDLLFGCDDMAYYVACLEESTTF